MAHTFDDWELRQLLEDTLEDAWMDYRYRRTAGDKPRGIDGKQKDWYSAADEAVQKAIEALWFEATRPAAAD